MSSVSVIKDPAPFLVSTGVTIDVTGKATVTGAVTLFSKKFVTRQMAEASFFAQGTGTGAGGSWKVFAANDYDPTRPVQSPGTWTDVTAAFGAAGAFTIPGVKNFAAAFAGAATDSWSTWALAYDAIQFQYSQASGTEVIAGQFSCTEI